MKSAGSEGIGVPQDCVIANAWANLAAAKLKIAAEPRDAVLEDTTPCQLKEAQKLSRKPNEKINKARSRAGTPQIPAP